MEQWSCKNEALRELKLFGILALKIAANYNIIEVDWSRHDAQGARRSGGHRAVTSKMRSLCAVVALELQQQTMTTLQIPSTIIAWLLVSLGLFIEVGKLEDLGGPF